jgi:hypothetical protein
MGHSAKHATLPNISIKQSKKLHILVCGLFSLARTQQSKNPRQRPGKVSILTAVDGGFDFAECFF